MKQLSIEEKAKAYDEALKVAKGLYAKGAPDSLHLEKMFPVLKESEDEDEKIRKLLVEAVIQVLQDQYCSNRGVSKEKVVAWLERRGEQKPTDKVIKEEKHLLEKFKQAVYDCAWGKVTCKKEGETKEEYANRWAEQFLLIVIDWADDYIDYTIQRKLRNSYEKGKADIIEKLHKQKPQGKSALEAAKGEKVDNQNFVKPVNEAEPKFHEGDWVVTSYGNVNQVIVVDKDGDGFTLDDGTYFSGSWKDGYHLWTIQDAKDGDVLTCYSDIKGQPIEQTGIIKQYVGWLGGCSNSFEAHFGVDWDNNVVIEGYMGSSNISPATKEQRDLLFQKMHEAGYEWDADKKELKKIEQKFNIGDEIKTANEEPLTITKIDKKGCWSEDLFICDFDAAAKWELVEQKSSWSEEDEKIYQSIMDDTVQENQLDDKQTDWLKSLKDRYTWKPSELQLECLDDAIKHYQLNGSRPVILMELLEELKKL